MEVLCDCSDTRGEGWRGGGWVLLDYHHLVYNFQDQTTLWFGTYFYRLPIEIIGNQRQYEGHGSQPLNLK